MKNVISKMSVLIAVSLVVLSATPANAQTSLMRVDIPFAFLAGNEVHPAGAYVFKVDSNFRLVDFRALDGRATYRIQLAGGLPSKAGQAVKGSLRFNCYGDTYALSGIWSYGAEQGYKVKPSKAESELARTWGGPVSETNIQTVR